MSYKLLIEAKPESKAKILGICVKSFLEGEEYSVSFKITNLGEEPFPGGILDVDLVYETNLGTEFRNISLPEIPPKESHETKEEKGAILSRGTALFDFNNLRSSDKKETLLFRYPPNPQQIQFGQSFGFIHATTHDEIYQFWAMVIAAISLFIIALEKTVPFFLWLYSILPI